MNFFEVRWLFKGYMLHRFKELNIEVTKCLKKKGHAIVEMEDDGSFCLLAFFISITTRLTDLNINLQ